MFEGLVLELMLQQCPWLLAIVKAADCQILAMPGRLYVAVPASSTDWIEVPGLSSQLCLLPWREGEEIEH